MEELIARPVDQVGIDRSHPPRSGFADRATAEEVLAFLELPGRPGDQLGGLR